jgi:hypothetical protein
VVRFKVRLGLSMLFRRSLIVLVVNTLITSFDWQVSTLVAQDLRGRFAPSIKLDPPGKWDSSAIPQAPGQTSTTDDLKIIVIDGEDGINIIKKQTAVQPVVEVRDRNDLPVAGAVVTFTTPGMGPSGAFMDGSHTFSTVTDSTGRAAVTGMTPAGIGAFAITVTARKDTHNGKVVISQTNVLKAGGAVGATAAGISLAHLLIIGGAVAAAAAVGTVVALNGGGGKPTGTIGAPGVPSITTPH